MSAPRDDAAFWRGEAEKFRDIVASCGMARSQLEIDLGRANAIIEAVRAYAEDQRKAGNYAVSDAIRAALCPAK